MQRLTLRLLASTAILALPLQIASAQSLSVGQPGTELIKLDENSAGERLLISSEPLAALTLGSPLPLTGHMISNELDRTVGTDVVYSPRIDQQLEDIGTDGNAGKMATEIRRLLDGDLDWPETVNVDLREDIHSLYTQREGQPLWYQDFGWNEALDAALFQIENAHLDGLSPEDYATDLAYAYVQATTAGDMAMADILISAAILPYVDHMANGRHASKPQFDPVHLLNVDFAQRDLRGFMGDLSPEKIEYQRLRDALARLRAEAQDFTPIPEFSDGSYLRLGDKDARVSELRHILTLTGDYVPDPAVHYNFEFDAAYFDEALKDAVLAFQTRKSLSADGIVGRGTRGALNEREASDIALIKVNMERLRWETPLNGESLYVRVNIPQYNLKVWDQGEIALDMKAIVGRRDRQTPIMSDRIVNLKYSPDWTVPSTIYREDILPQLVANPGYAAASGYSIITGNGRVSADTVDWSNPTQVTVYKKPSSNGPLGGVRFSLTNSIGIFLHDTNQRSLFGRDHRNLSSGCVRVGDPAGLAHYLTEHDGWSRDDVEAAMNRGRISWQDVNEGVGVPVFLSYMTLFVDEEGDLIRTGDPYRKDRALLQFFDQT